MAPLRGSPASRLPLRQNERRWRNCATRFLMPHPSHRGTASPLSGPPPGEGRDSTPLGRASPSPALVGAAPPPFCLQLAGDPSPPAVDTFDVAAAPIAVAE